MVSLLQGYKVALDQSKQTIGVKTPLESFHPAVPVVMVSWRMDVKFGTWHFPFSKIQPGIFSVKKVNTFMGREEHDHTRCFLRLWVFLLKGSLVCNFELSRWFTQSDLAPFTLMGNQLFGLNKSGTQSSALSTSGGISTLWCVPAQWIQF